MAAHLRSVSPSSSSLPSMHHRSGSSFSRLPSNHGACPFSGRSLSGKPLCTSTVYASPPYSSSSTIKDSYGCLHERHDGDGSRPEVDDNGDGGNGSGIHGGDGGGSGGGDDSWKPSRDGHDSVGHGGLFGAFLKGWKDRVHADPQFPFKVLMEEVVGVGACVLGDMASRPNFGLNELDFVFSTIVVGSILNFSLMYMLAPTSISAAAASSLPGMFASCPPGHMFEHGAYSVLDRLGTFAYKGAIFAMVGFGAGLLGTVISNALIGMRRKMDPSNELQVKAPPTILNAATWAIHMGVSSNFRYQVVNGLEFAMASAFPPSIFKASVLCTRAVNNVLGGMSFVVLARLTGSQKAGGAKPGDDEGVHSFQLAEHDVNALKDEAVPLVKEVDAASKVDGSG